MTPADFENDSSNYVDSSGSGLGLYIVKEMTERIGGTIQLQSTLGEGTTITLILPNLITYV